MPPTIVAFDLYGTLLSTDSIVRELAGLYGDEKAKGIAAQARRYQLEYTWRANSMGVYQSFSSLTRWSFRHAAEEAGVEISSDQEEQIMNAYNGLDMFSDAEDAIQLLDSMDSLEPYIFSNGTKQMITSSLRTSPSLSAASHIFPESRIVSVDPLRIFKPDRKVYQHLARTVHLETRPGRIWLVTSNPFDVVGAGAAGLKSAWVNRSGSGWIDGLGGATGVSPTITVGGVDEAIREIAKLSAEEGDSQQPLGERHLSRCI